MLIFMNIRWLQKRDTVISLVFTDTEVDILFEKYQKMTPVQRITVITGQAQDHMIILPKNR